MADGPETDAELICRYRSTLSKKGHAIRNMESLAAGSAVRARASMYAGSLEFTLIAIRDEMRRRKIEEAAIKI